MRQPSRPFKHLVALICAALATLSHAAADHTHLLVNVEVPAGETSGDGDALGVYAVQVQPCSTSSAGLMPRAHRKEAVDSVGKLAVERLLSVLSGTAHANHRDRFDGPAEAEFRVRVALDRSGRTSIGELILPSAQYCRVVLTLARLPSVQGLPALENALRLSVRGTAPLEIAFRESIVLTFDKPWVADGTAAQLKITLRPRATQSLLVRKNEDFGALSQRVMTRLTDASSAAVSPQ